MLNTQSGAPTRKRNGWRATVTSAHASSIRTVPCSASSRGRGREHGGTGAGRPGPEFVAPATVIVSGQAESNAVSERSREHQRRDHRRPRMETARAASRSATLRFRSSPLVVLLLAASEGDGDLGPSVPEVELERDQREALLLDGADELSISFRCSSSFRVRTGSWL